jgi:hypothetical protein
MISHNHRQPNVQQTLSPLVDALKFDPTLSHKD